MNLNLNGLNVYKPLLHLDLMIIFTMKEIFLKCRISMLFPFYIEIGPVVSDKKIFKVFFLLVAMATKSCKDSKSLKNFESVSPKDQSCEFG